MLCSLHVVAVTFARHLIGLLSAPNGKCKYISSEWSVVVSFPFPLPYDLFPITISRMLYWRTSVSEHRDFPSEEVVTTKAKRCGAAIRSRWRSHPGDDSSARQRGEYFRTNLMTSLGKHMNWNGCGMAYT